MYILDKKGLINIFDSDLPSQSWSSDAILESDNNKKASIYYPMDGTNLRPYVLSETIRVSSFNRHVKIYFSEIKQVIIIQDSHQHRYYCITRRDNKHFCVRAAYSKKPCYTFDFMNKNLKTEHWLPAYVDSIHG